MYSIELVTDTASMDSLLHCTLITTRYASLRVPAADPLLFVCDSVLKASRADCE